jgi:hypothetical protein
MELSANPSAAMQSHLELYREHKPFRMTWK